jgi:hypothetical protein
MRWPGTETTRFGLCHAGTTSAVRAEFPMEERDAGLVRLQTPIRSSPLEPLCAAVDWGRDTRATRSLTALDTRFRQVETRVTRG